MDGRDTLHDSKTTYGLKESHSGHHGNGQNDREDLKKDGETTSSATWVMHSHIIRDNVIVLFTANQNQRRVTFPQEETLLSLKSVVWLRLVRSFTITIVSIVLHIDM